MRPTRRYWSGLSLGGVLVGTALITNRGLPLVGAGLLGAWLIARQYQYLRAITALGDELSLDIALTPDRVATDELVAVELTTTLQTPSPLSVVVQCDPPVGAQGTTAAERTCSLTSNGTNTTATTAFTFTVPAAGVHTFGPSTVTVKDPFDLFETTISRGPTPTLQVEPRGPGTVHVGEGGEAVATTYGNHSAGRLGTGLDPAELRQYEPGDSAANIDWNATARLDDVYVREFDPQTDRETVLLLDHRSSLAKGPAGETAFAYLRAVALSVVASARQLDDPLGLYTVGDDGTTSALPAEARAGQYRQLHDSLQNLTPTANGDSETTADLTRPPAAVRRVAATLEDDSTTFAEQLSPFYRDTATYVQRMNERPLFGTARERIANRQESIWTVLLTDDTRRAELRETVKLARRGSGHALVFIAPQVLYEPGSLGDLNAAYDRYLDFEEFRRDLSGLERVSAFEVAPGDRLQAILASRRAQRRRQRVNS